MMFALFVVLLLHCSCDAFGGFDANSSAQGLHTYSEIHEAKNLIDALSFKLNLNFKKYEEKYESLQLQSNEYLAQKYSAKEEIKTLYKLKDLLNDFTKKSSFCEKFYSYFDFKFAREIKINFSAPLQKDYTVAFKVNHRELIDYGQALANGYDLRVYFRKDKDCQPKEIDRIIKDITTTKTMVFFKLQEDFSESMRDGSAYYFVYGNKEACKAKENPENVYLFFDDFSDIYLEKKWFKVFGDIDVENGVLKLKTNENQGAEGATGISLFIKNGYDFEDIEIELDFSEIRKDVAAGPLLRVQDTRLKSLSAWWFQYISGSTSCTMRPYKDGFDGKWMYQSNFQKPLSLGSWYHAKFRVFGDRFSYWLNKQLIFNNTKVSSKWFISKGTFGIGCQSGNTGCYTFYDNIKITKYVPIPPTVYLGKECKVDLKTFQGLGTSEKNPAKSCKQIYDMSMKYGKVENGMYWIKTSADRSVYTYCDLLNGGWTLVGKISGFVDDLYKFWLIKDYNLDALSSPALPSKVACFDARYLATYYASSVMFASGDNQFGIGSKWAQWSLPDEREMDSFWTYSVGFSTVSKAKMYPVSVKFYDGQEQYCFQNKYGIMPYFNQGGSYPSATYDKAGKTKENDYCMAIGVLKPGETAEGWTQNGSGYDSPQSYSDWPNSQSNYASQYVTVWLK